MAGIVSRIEIAMHTRKGKVQLSAYWKAQTGIKEDEVPCIFYYFFQDSSDGEHFPTAICELENGRIITTEPSNVTLDKEENEEC